MQAFDINSISDNSFLAVVAPRKAGKTHLVNYILSQMRPRRFSKCVVISRTSQLTGAFSFCDTHINPESGAHFESILLNILAFQHARAAKGLRVGEVLIICDDLFTESSRGVGRFSSALSKLAATGRHSHVFLILIAQRYQSISPSIRTQANYYITFSPRSRPERSMLMNNFLSRENLATKRETLNIANEALKFVFEGEDSAFRAMVIHADSRKVHIHDYVFYLKATEIIRPFKLKLKVIKDSESDDESDSGELNYLSI